MKKMIGTLLLAAAVVNVSWICYVVGRKRQKPLRPISGRLDNIKLESPNYTDTSKVGTRISFDFQVIANETTKLENALAYVCSMNHTGETAAHERPLFRPTIFPYILRKGSKLNFSGTVYVDDVRPEDINKNTLTVEFTDSTGAKYFI
jgi:hypothetical protein